MKGKNGREKDLASYQFSFASGSFLLELWEVDELCFVRKVSSTIVAGFLHYRVNVASSLI